MAEIKTAICRFCHSFCGIKVSIENGKAVKVVGDKDNPMYFGYTCVKGRQLPAQHDNPERLLHAQRRAGNGHERIASAAALDEIAATLGRLIAEHGPRSVALYAATYTFPYPAGRAMAMALMDAIGSPMRFTSATIDQPGKPMSMALHGRWHAGPQPYAESDAWILVGANPVVSKWGGIPQYNPAKRLHDALKNGQKLVVIDPRLTETAEKAHLHLQCKPGEDPAILAGIAHVMIEEGLIDEAFLAAEVDGFEGFKAAVAPFTPDYVACRAGVPAEQIVEAARIFGSARRGMITAGTGPNMAPRGTLTEYLVLAINTIAGRWLREGEKVPNPFVLIPERHGKAQAEVKPKPWGYGEQLRVRGLGENASGLTPAALAEEILLDGQGQVRALMCVGGNPMAAWPDQMRTYEAMKKLELLATIDIKMSATAKVAHYVLPATLGLEAPAITISNENAWFYGSATGYPDPYAQYQPKLVEPPAGADVLEEWEVFYGIGQRLGLQLRINGQDVDMVNKPTTDDLFEMICRGSRIPLSEVKKYPHGHIFDDPDMMVLPKDEGWAEKLDIGHPEMMQELAEVLAEPETQDAPDVLVADFGYRLVSRRLNDVYNSSGRDLPALTRNHHYNPAFMNPGDLAALGLRAGDVIRIASDHGSILGVAEEAPDVRPGVISMAHSFGDAPQFDNQLFFIGSNTGRLTDVTRDYDARTGMPRMSAIPVNITRAEASWAAE